jgi:hypothetical protein
LVSLSLLAFYVTPFQGLRHCVGFTQGAALGWYVAALSGLRKKMPFIRKNLY